MPELLFPSVEGFGIHVGQLAEKPGLTYINGENTITYFGVLLYTPDNENRTPFLVSCLCFQGLDSARFFRVSPVRRYTVQSVMGSAPRDR